MQYTWTGLNPVRDANGNVSGFKVNFSGSDDNQNFINGTIQITMEQFTATGGDVNKISDLIEPNLHDLLFSQTTTSTTISA